MKCLNEKCPNKGNVSYNNYCEDCWVNRQHLVAIKRPKGEPAIRVVKDNRSVKNVISDW